MPRAQPKEKLERRVGERLFLKGERSFSPKSAMARRPFPPGMHGKKFRRNKSEFGAQLKEKQKVRYLYGISDSCLRKYFAEALMNKKRSTAEGIAEILESRLDNTVFRAGLAVSRSVARHLVSYGHITVNGKRVRQPGFRVRPEAVIGISPASAESPIFAGLSERLGKTVPPGWMAREEKTKSVKIIRMPNLGDIFTQQNMATIVEYYSK